VGIDTFSQVGKTTVIRSLIKHYTKHNLSEVPLRLVNLPDRQMENRGLKWHIQIRGPITIIAGKKRRLTFIEVSNDLPSMLDAAKARSLPLLLASARAGCIEP
jgi:ribosome biogenesis protein BMS1